MFKNEIENESYPNLNLRILGFEDIYTKAKYKLIKEIAPVVASTDCNAFLYVMQNYELDATVDLDIVFENYIEPTYNEFKAYGIQLENGSFTFEDYYTLFQKCQMNLEFCIQKSGM